MSSRERARRGAILLLLALGLAQMLCDAAGFRAGKAVAAATLLAPAPRVFSAVRGFETYSARYFVEWEDERGAPGRLELDRAVYARLRGPYNRRNVYGAAFAYGPVLAADPHGRRMLEQFGAYAFGEGMPLLRELGLDPERMHGELRLRCEPARGTAPESVELVFLRHPLGAAR